MYLIDSDILVYSLNGNPTVNKNFLKYKDLPKAISVITYGELEYGALKSSKKIENLAKVKKIIELFPVLDVTPAVIETYALLRETLEKRGKPLDNFDLLIGATALVHGCKMVTHNVKHFARIPGLKIEDWAI